MLLLNKNHVPYLDTCVGKLLREEQHLLAQGIMSHDVVISNVGEINFDF